MKRNLAQLVEHLTVVVISSHQSVTSSILVVPIFYNYYKKYNNYYKKYNNYYKKYNNIKNITI